MRFLKENKKLFYIAFILPVFFFYLDNAFIFWVKDFQKDQPHINLLLEFLDPFINFISNGLTLMMTACLLFIIGKFFHKRLYNVGKSLIVGFLSAGIVVQIMKHLIGRARPRLTDKPIFVGPTLRSGYDSFPSGHTTVAFCFAYILSQYFPRYRVIFYTFAVIIGFERMEDFAHFPSDVLAGAVVGLIVGKLMLIFLGTDKSAIMPETRPLTVSLPSRNK